MSNSAEHLRAAIETYRRAIERAPSDVQLRLALGILLSDFVPPSGALEELERARALAPRDPRVHNALGILFTRLHEPERARQALEEAVRLAPGLAESWLNLGEVLRQQQKLDEAIEAFNTALAHKPALRAAQCSRGLALLQQGKFRQGWADYEARIGMPNFDTLVPAEPRWDGTPTEHCVLVHAEGGLGDTLQYVRSMREVRKRAPNSILAVRPELVRLLTSSGYAPLVSRGGPLPSFDMHVPLMSLPHVLGFEESTVSRDVPYLAAEPELVARWRQRLAALAGMKIGIHWQGNPRYWLDRFRSFPLAAFEPVARVPGVTLVSLQKGEARRQVVELAGRFAVVDLADELDTGPDAFVDTAAAMQSLDLMITSDTATAHLAGGLGVPVWLALNHHAEWRWLIDREDSPWYATMRLFRQTVEGDWSGVFEQIAESLTAIVRR